MNIEFIFCEKNDTVIDTENIRMFFPEAKISIYRDSDLPPICSPSEKWFGIRQNAYWQFKKLLESEADIAIAMDADMKIVSDNVRAIIPLTMRFGLCVPSNSRWLVKVDTEIGADSDKVLDDTLGMAYAFNSAIIALDTKDLNSRSVLWNCVDQCEKAMVRQPLMLWRAAYRTGFFPCLLPPQWCVCEADLGVGNEIILHVGHNKVREYYKR